MTIEKTLTFSDTHLLRDKGDFKGIKGHLLRMIRDYDKVVYNGDIFELFFGRYFKKEKLSLEHAQEKASKKALNRLEWIIVKAPDVRHEFVLGNHEDVPSFKKGLEKLAKKYANFNWHEKIYVSNDCLYLHGDLPFHKDIEQPREVYPVRKIEGMHTAAYVKAVQAYNWTFTVLEKPGMDALRKIRTPEKVARKNLEYLKENFPEQLEGVKYIISGHTHNEFEVEMEGYVLLNSGTQTMDEERNSPFEIITENNLSKVTRLSSFVIRALAEKAPKWIEGRL